MDIASLAVRSASRLGATEAEAYVQRSMIIQIGFVDRVQDINCAESMGLGLRVALGRRAAMHSTSILAEDEVGRAAERAMKIARVAPEDPHWEHLNRRFGGSPVEGCFDERIESIGYGEIMERLGPAIAVMKERDKRVKPTRGLLTLVSSKLSVSNSYGEHIEGKGTGAAAWMTVKAEDTGLESTGSEHQEARSWGDVDLETMAGSAIDKAIGFLEAKPVKGGVMPVIIRNQVAASIVEVMLSSPINADIVQKGGSPLAGKLGELIAAENISIVDDGTMPRGFGSRPFDDEGHPTQRTPVIENGVLRNFLYDNYTALKDGVDSTGNAKRSDYSSPPNPTPTNLILERGESGVDEIIEETQRGLYVENVIGEWLSNPVSGNLNATVTHGYVVEGGELGHPVKGVVLSGNFYELLKDGFEAVGDDTRNSGGYYSPTVKIRELTVAGE
jgi:PmbA protein